MLSPIAAMMNRMTKTKKTTSPFNEVVNKDNRWNVDKRLKGRVQKKQLKTGKKTWIARNTWEYILRMIMDVTTRS